MLNLAITHKRYEKLKLASEWIEYRKMTPHWGRHLWAKRDEINQVRFKKGYTKDGMVKNVLLIDIGHCPYDGWDSSYYRIHIKLKG